jgi:hypothetical protein
VLGGLLTAGGVALITVWWHDHHPTPQIVIENWTAKGQVGSHLAQATVDVVNNGTAVVDDCSVHWMIEKSSISTEQLVASSESFELAPKDPVQVILTQPPVREGTVGALREELQTMPTYVNVQCDGMRSAESPTINVGVEAESLRLP